MNWDINLGKFTEWLIEKGIVQQHWGRYDLPRLRMQFIRETNPEQYRKIVDMLGGKCEKCGYKICISGLRCHHINPKEIWGITTVSGYGKIMLFCDNCNWEIRSRVGAAKKAGSEE